MVLKGVMLLIQAEEANCRNFHYGGLIICYILVVVMRHTMMKKKQSLYSQFKMLRRYPGEHRRNNNHIH